jgi:hypothetical protein
MTAKFVTAAQCVRQVAEMPHVMEWLEKFSQLAKDMPKEVWVFSGDGGVHVLAKDENGQPFMLSGGGVDPNAILMSSSGGSWDGGDW